MIIIGITGTIGAGKGTIVEYLAKEKDFSHFSVRGYLLKVIRNRKLEKNRDNMVAIANELRREHGNDYIVKQLYLQAKKAGRNTIIESIRNVGEIDGLKELGDFILLAADAPPELRYKRIVCRKSETDTISFEEFLANEEREMQSDDPNAQNIRACMDRADYTLRNDKSFSDLHKQVEEILKKIQKKR